MLLIPFYLLLRFVVEYFPQEFAYFFSVDTVSELCLLNDLRLAVWYS